MSGFSGSLVDRFVSCRSLCLLACHGARAILEVIGYFRKQRGDALSFFVSVKKIKLDSCGCEFLPPFW